jgi:hypothetical protein
VCVCECAGGEGVPAYEKTVSCYSDTAIDQRKIRWLRAAIWIPEDASSNLARGNEFFVGRLQCQNNMNLVFPNVSDKFYLASEN